MGRSVSEAAAQAVRKSEKSKTVERTPEQVLADIRRNLAARLAVTPLDTAFLLAKYDTVQGLFDEAMLRVVELKSDIAELVAQIEASEEANLKSDLTAMHARVLELEAQVEQFRTVYEAENCSQAVKVEKVIPYPDSEYVVMEGDNQ